MKLFGDELIGMIYLNVLLPNLVYKTLFHKFTLTNKSDGIKAYLACCPRRGLRAQYAAQTQSTPPKKLQIKCRTGARMMLMTPQKPAECKI